MRGFFRQCFLKQRDRTTTVAWLPEKVCIVGKGVAIKQNDVWGPTWQIMTMGPKTDRPPDWRKLIKGHRKQTGDSIAEKFTGL